MRRSSKRKMAIKMKKNNLGKKGFNQGFLALEKNLSRILKPVLFKKKTDFLVINNLSKNWQKIVGENCWQFCLPKKIKFEKNKKANGLLTIGAHNSSVAFYLEAGTNLIIQNIASYYGYKIVSEIRIIQEPKTIKIEQKKTAPKLNPEQEELITNSIKSIKDEGLKSILQQLGTSIFKCTKPT